jgi:hypothetical protein
MIEYAYLYLIMYPILRDLRWMLNSSINTCLETKTNKPSISKLSRCLKIQIFQTLLGIDKDKIDKKAMLSLVYTFRECREFYTGSNGIFKLQHYLWLYSKKYHDVRFLAYNLRLPVEGELIPKFKCSVTDIHHISANINPIGIIKTQYQYKFKVFRHCFDRTWAINHCGEKLTLNTDHLVYHVDTSYLNKLLGWNCVLFDTCNTILFIHDQEIEMNIGINGYLFIKPSLNIEIFKKIVNEKEGRMIFSL